MDGRADLERQERCIVSMMHEDMRERMTSLSQSRIVARPLFSHGRSKENRTKQEKYFN